jgi:Copper transport outer membrane protein, MctB
VTAFRRYLFGVLAVCTAFAIGVALGGGPLRGNFVDVNASTSPSPAPGGSTAPVADRDLRLDAALTSAAGHRLLHNQLAHETVTVVVLPKVPHATVTGLVSTVQQAGGLPPVVVRLSGDLVDPAKKTYVDSVATSALKNLPDITTAAGADTYERIGAVLARAYVGTGSSATFDAEASSIDAQLQGSRLVRLKAAPVRRGGLLVVVAPRLASRGQYAAAGRVIQAQLVTAMAKQADGAVLLSPGSAGADSVTAGWPPGLKTGVPLSTLNVATGPASYVSAVYALLSAAHGQPGDFGVFGTLVRLPPGLAASGA